jgi:hypothetical protein
MPIRGSPNGARHPRPQVVSIARNGRSRSIGMSGRDQSESLVAIIRYAQYRRSGPRMRGRRGAHCRLRACSTG